MDHYIGDLGLEVEEDLRKAKRNIEKVLEYRENKYPQFKGGDKNV